MSFCPHYDTDSMKCRKTEEYVVATNVYDSESSKSHLYCMSDGKAHRTTKEILRLKGIPVPEKCPNL